MCGQRYMYACMDLKSANTSGKKWHQRKQNKIKQHNTKQNNKPQASSLKPPPASHRLLIRIDGNNGDDGAERLFAHNAHVVRQASQKRGGHEAPLASGVGGGLAAEQQLGAIFYRLADLVVKKSGRVREK